MKKQYHILNGDALLERFPEDIEGEIIVARECLIDGEVSGDSLDTFFENRARFISQSYGESEQEYFNKVKTEFLKILSIEPDSEVNLWFEDDLFCQVNFWFVVNLISEFKPVLDRVFLVRPKSHSPYGFSGLTQSELHEVLEHRIALDDINTIARLWRFYQENNLKELFKTAEELKESFPFILPAVQAHIDRIPSSTNPGRPVQSLIKIMEELETEKFVPVFREFCKREAIYGFGDLQVKQMFDQIINSGNQS